MKTFDLMLIGSGSGLEVSSVAAERGLSVAVVEEGPFGGTCLNRGCIPSKMLIHCADVAETIRQSHLFGIKARWNDQPNAACTGRLHQHRWESRCAGHAPRDRRTASSTWRLRVRPS